MAEITLQLDQELGRPDILTRLPFKLTFRLFIETLELLNRASSSSIPMSNQVNDEAKKAG